jgi:16S rRNA A1518/A1519 N6-dimethyltransferase RsmA/KsgA/DIM1 with predicted DNA glycosylase/AP lyase activity
MKNEYKVTLNLLQKYLVKTNRLVEHAAVRLCNIQPDDNVLEVGFGPGVGLNEAFKMVKGNV